MQSSHSQSGSFVKSQKRKKSFDDGYTGRLNNKKLDYNRQARANGNKSREE